MRLKNNILILDTETVGDFEKPLVHDLGYVIIDKNFTVLTKKRFLVKQVHETNWTKRSEFFQSKACLYEQDIENGVIIPQYWNDIVKEFISDIKTYKVNVISAYNLAFDYRALNFTEQFFNNGSLTIENLFDKKRKLCLWNLACETVLNTDEFRKFCDEYDFKSVKGNYLTNAEVAYRYLTQDIEFQEEHTALSDVLIETAILQAIVNRCKGIPQYGLAYSVWRKVQKPSK